MGATMHFQPPQVSSLRPPRYRRYAGLSAVAAAPASKGCRGELTANRCEWGRSLDGLREEFEFYAFVAFAFNALCILARLSC